MNPVTLLAFAVTYNAMTPGTVTPVIHGSVSGAPGEMADMGFHPKILFFLILGDLRGGDAGKGQHGHCARDEFM